MADLGFGDSGKGTITDALVRRLDADWVVRFNGGAQAAHNVVTPDGRHHTFSQFGSGMFVPGVKTYLSRYMVLHPGGLLAEAETLASKGVHDAMERVTIDPDARVITPFHQSANRLREILRGEERHGSCGLGVGETMSHSISHPEEGLRARDLTDEVRLRRKLRAIQQRYWQEFASHRKELSLHRLGAPEWAVMESAQAEEWFVKGARQVSGSVGSVRPDGTAILEGAQGVLLDEWRGFHPYTTWSTCTFDNAHCLVDEWEGEAFKLGVVRSYATRHGAGPFPTETDALDLVERHNGWGPWQEGFRVGWLDMVLLRYAVQACRGIDALAVTHLDRVGSEWRVCTAYDDQPEPALGPFQDLAYQEFLAESVSRAEPIYQQVESGSALLELLAELGPIGAISHGTTYREKRFLGTWAERSARKAKQGG